MCWHPVSLSSCLHSADGESMGLCPPTWWSGFCLGYRAVWRALVLRGSPGRFSAYSCGSLVRPWPPICKSSVPGLALSCQRPPPCSSATVLVSPWGAGTFPAAVTQLLHEGGQPGPSVTAMHHGARQGEEQRGCTGPPAGTLCCQVVPCQLPWGAALSRSIATLGCSPHCPFLACSLRWHLTCRHSRAQGSLEERTLGTM